jgi:hypothetical protein
VTVKIFIATHKKYRMPDDEYIFRFMLVRKEKRMLTATRWIWAL